VPIHQARWPASITFDSFASNWSKYSCSFGLIRRRFDEDHAAVGHGRERSGDDFLGALGELGADFAVFGNVQVVDRVAAHRGADRNRGSVLERQFVYAVRRRRVGVTQRLRQPVIGKLDLLENLLGRIVRVSDHADVQVGREEREVEEQDLDQRREPQLPGLQDQIFKPEPVEQPPLRAVRLELDHHAVAVLIVLVGRFSFYVVQVRQPPHRIGQSQRQIFRRHLLDRRECDGLTHSTGLKVLPATWASSAASGLSG
jgi:hypothetical protein